ncbi:MAG TPA: alpha/beta hydrolase-fold protein [Acidimicrobiia bacterium]|nr:alpha/beta hydrolase-fold protein [Acidimicrobiia bacterium]
MKKPAVVSELETGDKAAIDRFIAGHEFPIVEPGQATFMFRGTADAVSLRPMIAGFPGTHHFAPLNGHDLWWLALSLPDGARLEYKLEVQRDHHADWVNDPLNPITTTNPFGTNSVCRGFGYRVPDFAEIHEGTPNGSFEDQWIGSRLGGDRKVTVYLPAGFGRDRRYPLVFVHDGGDYLTYGSMALVLDNLIHWKVIPPVIAAFSWPGDRLHEYAANSAHADFVVNEALPKIEQAYPISDFRVVMGASLGAVAALHTAWQHNDAFSALLLQSGTFAQTPGWGPAQPILGPIADLLHRLEPSNLPHQVYLSCGTYERMIGENRYMAQRLQKAGVKVKYSESRDGHTWEAWRDRLSEGLSWLLPG